MGPAPPFFAMAQVNKIEKYKLQSRCLALFREGRTTAEIAVALTADLNGQDRISQPSVARWLKPIREEERDETQRQVREYIKKTVESDLEILDEVQAFMVEEFRNDDCTTRERSDFGLKALRVVETKLRFALTDPNSGESAIHPVDLDEFRNDLSEIKEGLCDA